MKAVHIQRALALIFLGLGGWTLLAPGFIERIVLRPQYFVGSEVTALLLGCFGAQAMLAGVVIATSRFTPRTFLIFGLVGSLPFLVFNYYFYFVRPLFTGWVLLDTVGNLGILACGLLGYRLATLEAASETSPQGSLG